MSSPKIKDLLIINLTAAIALVTSNLLPKLPNSTSQIDPIALAYWLIIGLLLILYADESFTEDPQKQDSQRIFNRERSFCRVLEINLAFIGAIIAILALCYIRQVASDRIISIFTVCYLIEIVLLAICLICFSNLFISFYHYMEEKINSPIKLFAAAIIFLSIIDFFYFLVHS